MGNHNEWVLSHLREYDSFLDSLRTICDMGCGTGEDITWWATLETRDDPPVPYNYNCFAVDKDPKKLAQVPDLTNINKINKDFNELCCPVKIDLLWSHDSLQYSTKPLETLKLWNEQMSVNGMLLLSIPQHSGVKDNRFYSRSYSGCYYHYTPVNLIYMLAVNGFDCRDAYMLKRFNDEWLQIAVYKTKIKPMDPATTSWFDLIDLKLLNPSVEASINKFGHLRQEDIVYPWLDKENYFVDYVSSWTEIPQGVETTVEGSFNETTKSDKTSILQNVNKEILTPKLKPVGVMRPPKKE